MRYYLERKDGRRVTFEVARDGIDAVLVMAVGKEERMTKAQARTTWSSLVKGGAVQVECHDPEGHDGECCSCSTKALEAALEKERQNPNVRGGNGHDRREHERTARNINWDPIKDGPLPGTWAFTARELVKAGLMSGDEADEWKDQMKDGFWER